MRRIANATQADVDILNLLAGYPKISTRADGSQVPVPPDWRSRVSAGERVRGVTVGYALVDEMAVTGTDGNGVPRMQPTGRREILVDPVDEAALLDGAQVRRRGLTVAQVSSARARLSNRRDEGVRNTGI
jgi:hypothetical protein